MNDGGFESGDVEVLLARLAELKARHAEIERDLEALEWDAEQQFRVMALKREKLRVKDRIAWLASKVTPDIIA